jgi:capsular polysaccharide biosynthesis protein
MMLRSLAKTGCYYARIASVHGLAVPRGIAPLRRLLHLPSNHPLDPLNTEPIDGITIKRLEDGDVFRRPLPDLSSDPEAVPFFESRALEQTAPSYVAELQDGAFWGYTAGAVFTRTERFVPVFTRDPWTARLHAVWTKARLPRFERLRGRTLYLVTPEAENNFHHWMIDLLPRIGMTQRAGYSIEQFDHIVINHRSARFQLETLARFGVPSDRICVANPRQHFRADVLVVPSLKTTNQCAPASDVDALRAAFLDREPAVTKRRRIYLTRRDAGFRRLLNEDALLPLLAKAGFEIVAPASLSVGEQARLFAESEAIAGPSGAGFANLAFASSGARVLEIAPPGWLTVYHWMISARRGLHHTVIVGEGKTQTGTPNITDRSRDVTLSPGKLTRWIDSLEGPKPTSSPTGIARSSRES